MPKVASNNWVKRIAASATIAILTLVCAEVVVRVVNPVPRVQVLRAERVQGYRAEPHQPMHASGGLHELERLDCIDDHPDYRVVVIVSDSILHTGSTEDISAMLRRRPSTDGWCVVNGSTPGFYGNQQLSAGLRYLDRLEPDLVIWGMWKPNGRWLAVNETTWMETSALNVGEDGRLWPKVIPAELGRVLLSRSLLAQHVAVLLSGTAPPGPDDFSAATRMAEAVRARGADMVILDFPALNVPFGQTSPKAGSEEVLHAVRDMGFTVIDVSEAFRDEDVETLRRDTCCHYNDQGTQRLADLIEPFLGP